MLTILGASSCHTSGKRNECEGVHKGEEKEGEEKEKERGIKSGGSG